MSDLRIRITADSTAIEAKLASLEARAARLRGQLGGALVGGARRPISTARPGESLVGTPQGPGRAMAIGPEAAILAAAGGAAVGALGGGKPTGPLTYGTARSQLSPFIRRARDGGAPGFRGFRADSTPTPLDVISDIHANRYRVHQSLMTTNLAMYGTPDGSTFDIPGGASIRAGIEAHNAGGGLLHENALRAQRDAYDFRKVKIARTRLWRRRLTGDIRRLRAIYSAIPGLMGGFGPIGSKLPGLSRVARFGTTAGLFTVGIQALSAANQNRDARVEAMLSGGEIPERMNIGALIGQQGGRGIITAGQFTTGVLGSLWDSIGSTGQSPSARERRGATDEARDYQIYLGTERIRRWSPEYRDEQTNKKRIFEETIRDISANTYIQALDIGFVAGGSKSNVLSPLIRENELFLRRITKNGEKDFPVANRQQGARE